MTDKPESQTPDRPDHEEVNLPVMVRGEARQPTAAETVTGFVREHPVLVVAGGLAAGILAAGLFPRRNRKRVKDSANHLAEMATAAVLPLMRQMLERAQDAGEDIRRQGEKLAGKAEGMGLAARDAARDTASRTAARAGTAATSTARRIVDIAADIQSRMRH